MDEMARDITLGSVRMDDDGILHVVVDYDDEPSEEIAREYLLAREELTQGSEPPVLVEVVQTPFVGRDVRKLLMSQLGPAPARAIVTADPGHAMMWRGFELAADEGPPTRIFQNPDAARTWLLKQMED